MAENTGDQASFTWSNPTGNALVVAQFDFWAFDDNLPPELYRPFGWIRPKAVFGTRTLRGVLRHAINDANPTPPIPTGAAGDLVLATKTGTDTYTFKASLYGFRHLGADSTRGNIQMVEYSFIFNATASNDTVAVA